MVRHVHSLKYMGRGRFRFKLQSLGYSNKHRQRSLVDPSRAAKAPPAVPKVFVGKIPAVKAVIENPLGFDKRLLEKTADGTSRIYVTVDPRLFRDNYEALMEIVRKNLPKHAFGEPLWNAKFKAVFALHKWMVDRLEEERNATDAAARGGGGGGGGGG